MNDEAVSLETALFAARMLADDGSNTEYVRGMCELLATCFPTNDVEPDERAEWFEQQLVKQR